MLGGGAHWCVAGRSAGSKAGMDCVDLVVVPGKRDKHRRVGFSAHPVPTDDPRNEYVDDQGQLELKPVQPASE